MLVKAASTSERSSLVNAPGCTVPEYNAAATETAPAAVAMNVVAMVQHDMDLWKAAGAPDKVWFVNNNTDSAFNDMMGQLVDGYAGMAWGKASLSGGSSDHALKARCALRNTSSTDLLVRSFLLRFSESPS